MGLDVHVITNVKEIKKDDEENYVFEAFVIDDRWLHKIKNLKNGTDYTGDYTGEGVSCAYSGHGRFREQLILLIKRKDLLDDTNNIDWDKLLENKDIPFYDLIDFADNEGCLDFEINAKIYKDFLKYQDKAMEFFKDDNWNKKLYTDWLGVFEAGSKKGNVVVFG